MNFFEQSLRGAGADVELFSFFFVCRGNARTVGVDVAAALNILYMPGKTCFFETCKVRARCEEIDTCGVHTEYTSRHHVSSVRGNQEVQGSSFTG